MKIGIILISHGWAGAEIATMNLIKNLKSKKINVALITNHELIKNFKEIKDLKVYDLGRLSKKNVILELISYLKIRRLIKKAIANFKPDLVSLSLIGTLIAYMDLYDKQKVPVILNLHGQELTESQIKEKVLLRLSLNKALIKSNRIVSVSHSEEEFLKDKFMRKFRVVNNGVDTKIFRKIKLKKLKKTILFAGRYIDLKGIKEIIRVSRKFPKYKFLFVGQGPLKEIIKGKNIEDLGFKNQKELAKIYNKVDFCIFPSHSEGFGNVGLEAMACGKPVIATLLGFSEYIENGKDGIIIPAKDEKALEKAIIMLMENPKLRERLGNAARKKAEQYSWSKITDKHIEIYNEVFKKITS